MARYFFHVKDGRMAVDHTGLEFDNDHDVRQEALRGASEMLVDENMGLWLGNEWVMTVVNEFGDVMFNLKFSIDQPKRHEAVQML